MSALADEIQAAVEVAIQPLRNEVAALRKELALGIPPGTGLLDVKQAAKVAGVEPNTIRKWATAGTLRIAGSGRPLRFNRDHLEEDVVKIREKRRAGKSASPDVDAEEFARQRAARKAKET